jgi:hypothetical protein
MRGIRLAAAVGALLLLLGVAEAGAETTVVTFDNLEPGTTVSDQYKSSHGVSFAGPNQGDGAFPVIRAVSPGLAHSGSQVADISFCFACEFYTPRTVGRLTSTVSRVSAFVGFIGSAVGNAPATVRLTVRNAAGQSLGTSTATVVQGQPFDQMVSVTSPNATPDIASFEFVAEPPNTSQTIGFDDLSLITPDIGPPADFALRVGSGPIQQGTFVDVPIELDRLNGSNGNVTLSVSGLPPGMSGTFSPNPVPGIDTAATLRLSADPNAPSSDYTEITITGLPGSGAGSASRAVTMIVRVIGNCGAAQVAIGAPPETGPVSEYTVSSAIDLNDVLRSDFTGRVIVPRDVEWELVDCNGDHLHDIPLHTGVELIGERGELGSRPTLFTDFMETEYPVFVVQGNDVRVQGLNFRGPQPGRDHESGKDDPYVEAIWVQQDSDGTRKAFGHRVTIADNEFSQWTHAGVVVDGCTEPTYDGCALLDKVPKDWDPSWPHLEFSDAGTLLVENNYMHHNARDGGGYGVVVGAAGFVTVIGNVFDHNRHAVAASGRSYSGYDARFNYVLSGGYKQGSSYNQHFDVHGTAHTGYGGYAGDRFEIAYNTIRGEQTYSLVKTRPALMLRGKPVNGLFFHDNVVVHDDLDSAVSLKWKKSDSGIGEDQKQFNFHASGNHFDVDYTAEIAAGDFDGDRRTDVFVANGTGWFFSRGGRQPWEFLHASNKRTRDLGFADVDNDGITDVLYRDPGGNLGFLKSGKSDLSPLTPVPVPIKDLRFGDFNGDGLTDIFYTLNKQWNIWYGGTGPWTPAASSSTSISEMLFGEFDEVRGTDVAAVRNGAWSYSSGGTEPWARLNNKLVGSFKDAVAADFNGNGQTDIAFIQGDKWRYSPDGRSPLVVMRKGVPALKPLLIGLFDGDSLQAQVASWAPAVGSVGPGGVVFRYGLRLIAWQGLGTGNDFKALSRQDMR